MQVTLFNRGPRRKLGRKPAQQPANVIREAEDTFGILDPGFEDIGIKVHDYHIAPGMLGHFATMENPPSNYFAMPTLERIGAK